MIRLEAGMPTARFVRLIGVPERSYRRWQQRQRQGRPAKGPWPTPSADRIEPAAIAYADRYPQWGSRTIATLMRIDGLYAPDRPCYRALKRSGRVLEVNYQAERRQHAEARRAVFVVPPSGPEPGVATRLHRVRNADGRTWRIGGTADYWSRYELGWHVSTDPEPPRRDPDGRDRARRDRTASRPPAQSVSDPDTGVIEPVAVVTDNGPLLQVRPVRRVHRQASRADPLRTRRKALARMASVSVPSAR